MSKKFRLGALLCSGAAASLIAFAATPAYAQEQTYSFSIPAEDLASALRAFGRQSHLQVIFDSEATKGGKSAKLDGSFTATQALRTLLAGTGFVARLGSHGEFMVTSPGPGTSTSQGSGPGAGADAGTPVEISEVVVTAQKRTEKLSEVPMSVAVLSGVRLERSQSNSLQDIVNKVPGVQLVTDGPIDNNIVIRGIYANGVSSSTATYVDEVPYTSQGPFAASTNISPNLDPYDLARVEVLKGPQGTLYGANALAGLLKYVTNPPDPSHFSASILVGGSTTDHAGDGYEVHGMVNLPLSDTAALRVVANDTRFPGYIDDVQRHVSGLNTVDRYSVRAALLWQATPDLTVRLSALYQYLETPDEGLVDLQPGSLKPFFGTLAQQGFVVQPNNVANGIYNATIDWNLGFANLISSTSYSQLNPKFQNDLTSAFAPSLTFGGNLGVILQGSEPVNSVTQELRLASPTGHKLEWTAGAYFTHETADEHEPLYPVDLDTGQVLKSFDPNLGAYLIKSTYREYAGFGDLTYHLTPAFEVGLGGRYSWNHQTYHQVSAGLFTGATDFETPSSEGATTYSVDAKYRFNSSAMIYGRIASGFVPGGPNDAIPGSPLPSAFRSSTDTNYELGVKGNLVGGMLSYSLDAFDIKWQNIQLSAVFDNIGGIVNGGAAFSRGLEGELDYTPIHGLNLSLGGAYTDARLTQSTPASVGGIAGDRLPLSPYFSSNLSLDYERPAGGDLSAFGGLDWQYVGDRISNFNVGGPRQTLPGYSMVNLRTGLKLHRYIFTVYIKNVGDVRAINTVFPTTIDGKPALQAAIGQPRTLGVTLSASF